MRHFIGGAAVGFVFAIAFTKPGDDRIKAIGLFSVLFGLAAWGLWP